MSHCGALPVECFTNLPLRILGKAVHRDMSHYSHPNPKIPKKFAGGSCWPAGATGCHASQKMDTAENIDPVEAWCWRMYMHCRKLLLKKKKKKKAHTAVTWPWESWVHYRNWTLEETFVPQKLPSEHWNPEEKSFPTEMSLKCPPETKPHLLPDD